MPDKASTPSDSTAATPNAPHPLAKLLRHAICAVLGCKYSSRLKMMLQEGSLRTIPPRCKRCDTRADEKGAHA